MKLLPYFILIPLVFMLSCKKETNKANPDQKILQSQLWAQEKIDAGTVITYGFRYPYISVKLGADNHYQVIRDLGRSTDILKDTLTGTYSYNATDNTVKFSGDKIKQVTRPRVNAPEQVYFPDWKITSITADTIKIRLDYGTYPTEAGMEFNKVLVRK